MRLYKDQWALEQKKLLSKHLDRKVTVDFYFPTKIAFGQKVTLLLFNDGQILREMSFLDIIKDFYKSDKNNLLVVAGVHANEDRLVEYGTIGTLNYKGQGAKAEQHALFLIDELLPFTFNRYPFLDQVKISIAGFSLGGLAAFDLAWTHPYFFDKVGVFSGSFWWRDKDCDDEYDDSKDKIMLQKIRQTDVKENNLKFYFECGTEDESNDRNNNGIIDSIDDTMDLIHSLEEKGYNQPNSISYNQIEGGKHDVPTWKDAMPSFLEWGWGDEIAW